MNNIPFEEWRVSERNEWKDQDEHTQRMMWALDTGAFIR